MKLYNLDLSNFASKTRIALYEKGVNFEKVPPPGGLGSADYKKVNPLGKVPALVLDNGQLIAESEIINEYLEDKYPEKPLLPKDAEGRARVRSFTRFHDLYLEPPLRAMFPKLFGQQLDDKFIQEKVTEVNNRLDQLEAMIGSPYAAGSAFTLADAALAPTMFFMTSFLPQLGAKAPTEGRPKIAAWWNAVQQQPSVKKVLGEQQAALQAMMKK
ncbi:MAG TPA: glutathione S-transferase family protein [Methylomirabilota bacterium]|jgi:glutathione S-transferase|nr:glutathione S-transferase family protein [Methylomirabilota bacterium]